MPQSSPRRSLVPSSLKSPLRSLYYLADAIALLKERGMLRDGPGITPALDPAELLALDDWFDAGVPVSDFVEWVAERRGTQLHTRDGVTCD